MKDYELFNDSMSMDEPYNPHLSHHKFDFTNEIEGYSQPASSKPNTAFNMGSALSANNERTSENKGLIEVTDPRALQLQFEDQLLNAGSTSQTQVHRKIPVAVIEPDAFKKAKIKSISKKMSSGEDSDSSPAPRYIKVERKPSASPPVLQGINKAQSLSKNHVLNGKREDANKIGLLVQEDMSFGDTTSSEEEYLQDSSDSYSDRSEVRLKDKNGKLKLRKLQTNIPEKIKLNVAPSEMLNDFFDDPLEHPLLPNTKFSKHKSVAPKKLGSLKHNQSLFGGSDKLK
jgi:hypothetical protein